MKSGIEELTFELLGLQEEKRLMVGMVEEMRAGLSKCSTPSERSFYNKSIAELTENIAELDEAIAVRERVRKAIEAMPT